MLANNIIRQLFTQIIGLVCGFAISIITARILGPAGRGDFSLLLNTSSFISLLLGFSFGTSIIHVISSHKMPQRNIINSFSVIVFFLSLICGCFIYIFPFSKFAFLLPSNYQDHKFFYTSFLFFIFIISMMSTLYNSVLSGNRLFWRQQKVFIISTGISIVAYLCLYVIYSKSSIRFIFFLKFYSILMIIPLLGLIIMYVVYVRPNYSFSFLNIKQLKYVLNFSLLAYLANIFQFLSYRMDFWFVGYFNGNINLGVYSIAVNLSQMLWLLPQAISTILLSYSGANDLKTGIRNTNSLSRIAMFLVFFSAIILELSIHLIIPALYGVDYKDSVPLMQILLVGIAPFSMTTILASYFAGIGRMKVNLFCSLIGFLVCLVFDLILIPKYGNTGAALATIVAYFASTSFILFVYIKKTNSKLVELIIINKADIFMIKNKLEGLIIKNKL